MKIEIFFENIQSSKIDLFSKLEQWIAKNNIETTNSDSPIISDIYANILRNIVNENIKPTKNILNIKGYTC